jgi:hypothetical protein
MGRSFYLTRKYRELRDRSQSFSDQINATPLAFGITAPMALEYKTLNDLFVAKFALADDAATRTTVTLLDRNNSAKDLVAKAAELAGIIEHTPTVTDGQRASLGLSVRATPTPSPAPGTCSDFKVKLGADGSVQSSWKANNSKGMTGVTYQVYRRFGSEGEFEFVGASGLRKFVDTTIPAGTAQVQYQIRGIRPTGAGEWAQFNVNFGVAPGGVGVASVVQTAVSPKLAA